MEPHYCLVSGANGFVGKQVVDHLQSIGKQVVAATRSGSGKRSLLNRGAQVITVEDIRNRAVWEKALTNQDVVIHLANRAHVMHEGINDPLPLFREVNVEGSIALAQAAIAARVKRFIFVSSIKVNGEATIDRPFQYSDAPCPTDPYALSKWEAEQQIEALCAQSEMELVIIRPPLVYGPGVKGNLAALKSLVNKPIPLPLASINNQRDLISLTNLVDLITVCIDHPQAAGETFLCCDDEPVSTPELIRFISEAQSVKPLLFRFPVSILARLARLAGKTAQFERLAGDLRIDMSHTKSVLAWSPPHGVADSMHWAFSSRENL